MIHSQLRTTRLPSQRAMFEDTKTNSAPGLDKVPGATTPSRSSECRAYVVGNCDEEIASNSGIAEIDSRTVIAAGQLKRDCHGLPGDEIHDSTPAMIATMAAAMDASSFTPMITSTVAIDGSIRCLSRK